MSQGNYLYNYLKQKKCHFIFLKKNVKQEERTSSVWGVGTRGIGEDVEKGYRRVNIIQILCTYVYKWKINTC
jgi:hypothetical protein